MSYFTDDTLNFLNELKENNNKEWFHENKKRYEESVKNPFKKFVEDLIFLVTEFDSEVSQESKNAIFRINRDIRFTKDKSPYKTHLGASFNGVKRNTPNCPGYYVHVAPTYFQLGGGAYFLDKNGTQSIRESIRDNPRELRTLINNKAFKSKFGEINGKKNKRLPKEFVNVEEPLIFYKNYYYMAELPPETIFKDNLLDICKEYCIEGSKINQYLREALN